MNIFMFHFGRCGSTVLSQSIEQIPGFAWHGEIFSSGVFVYEGFNNSPLMSKQGGGIFTIDEFIFYLKSAKSGWLDCRNDVRYYGCEIKSYHFEYNYFRFTLEDALIRLQNEFPDCMFIFLYRENSLRRVVSAIIAKQTSIYHSFKPVEKANAILLDFDNIMDIDLNYSGHILDVLKHSAQKEQHYSYLIEHYGGFVMSYEKHIEPGVAIATNMICDKLSVNRIEPTVKLHKTNPGALEKLIINYNDLTRALSDTNFSGLLK